MDRDLIEALLKSKAYHLKGSSNYHVYIDCPPVAVAGTRAEDLRVGTGGGTLCGTCKRRLHRVVTEYAAELE